MHSLFWKQFYSSIFDDLGFGDDVSVHPAKEILCYEARQAVREKSLLRRLHDKSRKRLLPPSKSEDALPDDVLEDVAAFLLKNDVFRHEVVIRGTCDYPGKLLGYDIPLLYYQGDLSLLSSPCIAVDGTRMPTEAGRQQTVALAEKLVASGYTILAGLRAGVQSIAHATAMECGGHTVAVMATPISHKAKSVDGALQERIAKDHLLVSHVPFYRSANMSWEENKLYFGDCVKVMGSLCEACVYTELLEDKTLPLARETVAQGKPLIFCQGTYDAKAISWVGRYAGEHGAILADSPAYAQKVVERVCRIG